MQSSSEQPLVGEEHCVTTLITAAKETRFARNPKLYYFFYINLLMFKAVSFEYLLEHQSMFKLRMKLALSMFEIDRPTE